MPNGSLEVARITRPALTRALSGSKNGAPSINEPAEIDVPRFSSSCSPWTCVPEVVPVPMSQVSMMPDV